MPADPCKLGRAIGALVVVAALIAPATAAAKPVAHVADINYGPLSRVGAKASGATLQGRVLTVKLRLRKTAGVRLSLVPSNGDVINGYTKRVLAPGNYTLRARLRGRRPSGTNLRLRVTVRLTNGERGRERIKVKFLPEPAPPASNTVPSNIALTAATVAENQPAGTTVGTLAAADPDPDTLTFSLVSGTGSADNGSFTISGTTLKTAASFDFEAKPSHSIRVKADDGHGGRFEKQLTISVTDVNEAPTDATLTPSAVTENQPVATTVGTLVATDPDSADTHTFTLVAGTGSTDNASFTISGAQLKTAATFDYETKSSYSVRVKVDDGHGGTFEKVFAIAITDANDAPTAIDLSSNTIAENQAAATVVGTLSATDQDSADTHTFALVAGTGSTDNGSFTIVGNQLRSAASFDFEAKSSYAIRVGTDDGHGGTFEQQFTITVTDANDPPSVTTSGGALAYTEGDPATVIDPGVTVADVDDTHLEGATITILGVQPGDELGFVDTANITGSFAAGVLTLTGHDTLAAYQTALRSVTYRSTSDDPGTGRTVQFVVNDGTSGSNAATHAITITPVNDAPVITTTASALSYPELAGPVAADPGVTLSDADSSQISGATVQITSGFDGAQDELAFADQLGITGAYDDSTGTLTLTGTTSVANYQAALRAVTYENGSSNPTTTRTLTFLATDAGGATSTAQTRDITIGASNNAPVVTTSAGAVAYTENAAPILIDNALTVADADDTNLEGARVAVSGASFDSGDALGFSDQNGITGTYNAGTGVLTLSGTSSLANYQTALRSIIFSSTSNNPNTAKTVEYQADDGDGLGPMATRNIDVTRVNDAPVLTTTAADLSYTEGDGAQTIDTGLTLTDADSSQISGATVAISANFQSAQDTLGFADQNGISGSYDAGTGVLTLTGTATVAEYQAALRSATYANSSEGPSPASRTISFQATDSGAAVSNLATRGIAITGVNDPPTAVDDSYTTDEDTTLNVVAPGVLTNDTDLDPGDTKTASNLSTAVAGATASLNADGSITYNPGTAFQQLHTGETGSDTLTYTVTDGAGATDTGTINVTINGISDAPVPDADSYTLVGNTALFVGTTKPASDAGKEQASTTNLLVGDADPEGDTFSATAETKATSGGGTVTIESDGDFTFNPDDGDTSDSFTYQVCDPTPACASGNVSLTMSGEVWYVKNNAAAGGDGTSDTPFDTLTEAETASGANDYVYVYDGDNTSTNLGGDGYQMDAGEHLIGEDSALTVGGTPLRAANAGARPTLTATNADVISLDDANELNGLDIDPSGVTGGGIAGASGDAGTTTISNVSITDAGTKGSDPGLELVSTTGSFNVSSFDVTNGDGSTATSTDIGVRLSNAGTVDIDNATISTDGAKALDVDTTNVATSTLKSVVVTNSNSGGIRLNAAGGTSIALGDGTGTDMSLTTGGGTALQIASSAAAITANASGTNTITATNGPAVDVTATTGVTLPLDGVSSSGSGTDGINLDGLGAGTFTATGGTISGAAGIAFDLNGGDGTVSYPGTLGNGTGATAEITGRSGGAVTLSGPIADTNDAGGGIALSGSTGGSTTFSNASKVINTGAGATAAVSMSGTHTLSFQGGGLDIDTTTAPGMDITGGTIDVQGSGNSITTGSGRALNVSGAGIGAPDMTFASISSNGATNGIALSSTGSSGGLAVSGGTIQSSTGPGILLTNVGGGVDLSGNTVTAGGDDGIRGTNVAGFAMSGTSVTSNGNAVGENGLDFTGLTGTVALTIPTVTGSADRNVAVVNDSGTLNMTVINGTIANTSSTTGDDGVLLLGTGSGSMTATIQGTTFTDNKGDQVNMSTDADATLTQNLTITGTTMSTTAANQGPAGYVVGGGITVNPGGSANSDVTITNNNIQRATDEAIVIDTPGTGAAQPVNIDATITGNTIGTAGTAGSGSSTGTGIFMSSNGAGDIDAIVSNNSVREYANGSGIHLIQNDGNGKLDATVQNNVITNPGAFGLNGIRAEAGAAGGDAGTMCLDVGHASTLALKNNVFQGGKESAAGEEDMRVRQRFDTTVQLAGYSGASDNTTDVANYLIARNNAGGTPTASATVNNGAGAEYVSVVSCVQP